MTTRQDSGERGQFSFYCLLAIYFGKENVKQPVKQPGHYGYPKCEFSVFDKKLELKTARPFIRLHHTTHIWRFNIHRHGEMPTVVPDYYVLRLEPVPEMMGKKAVHLLFHGSEVTGPTRDITLRSLMDGDFQYALRFKDFCKRQGEFAKLAR